MAFQRPSTGLSLSQLRKIDPSLAHLSDERLEAVKAELYGIAQLAFEVFCAEKQILSTVPKIPLGHSLL